MTNLLTLDGLGAALSDATTALSTRLPVRGHAGPPLDGRDPGGLVPGPGARAVVVTAVGSARARVVLALSASAASALEDGPLGPQDLASALEGPLLDALASLEPAIGGPLHLEAQQALDADLALTTAVHEAEGDGAALVAVPLLDGEAHVATLAAWMAGQPDRPGAVDLPDLDAPAEPRAGADGPSPSGALDLLADVEMQVTVELGRTRLAVRDLLALSAGSIVELDRAAGSPVDLLVNGTLVARGEVVVVDDDFGVRITEIVRRQPPTRGR